MGFQIWDIGFSGFIKVYSVIPRTSGTKKSSCMGAESKISLNKTYP